MSSTIRAVKGDTGMRITRMIAILLIGVLLILGACTNTAPTAPTPTTPTPVPEPAPIQGYTEVLTHGRNFNPDAITIGVGTTVSWISQDGEQHSVTSDIPGLFDGTILPFGSFSYTFTKSGDFEYFCGIHGQMGMRGVVHVK